MLRFSFLILNLLAQDNNTESHFMYNKHEPNQILVEKINQLCQEIDNKNLVKIIVEGHTDLRGSVSYNIKLSQKRAETVKNMLVDVCKVDGNKIYSVGMGKLFPISNNHDSNRRVVIHIVQDKSQTVVINECSSPTNSVLSKKENKHFIGLLATTSTNAKIHTYQANSYASVQLQRSSDLGLTYNFYDNESDSLIGIGATFGSPSLIFTIGISLGGE